MSKRIKTEDIILDDENIIRDYEPLNTESQSEINPFVRREENHILVKVIKLCCSTAALIISLIALLAKG